MLEIKAADENDFAPGLLFVVAAVAVVAADDADANNASSISSSSNCRTDAGTNVMDDFDFELLRLLLVVVADGCGNTNNILGQR